MVVCTTILGYPHIFLGDFFWYLLNLEDSLVLLILEHQDNNKQKIAGDLRGNTNRMDLNVA